MYNKYFEEYYIPAEELKVKICGIIENLSSSFPDEFNANLLDWITPQQDTQTFLKNLTDLIPSIDKVKHNFEIITEIEALRVCAITLDSYLYTKMLDPILLKLIYMMAAGRFIGFRYLIAVELIENTLNEDLKYEPRLLYEEIMNPENPERVSVYETLLAQEEIGRVCNNEKTKDFFWNLVEEFESSIENYIKKGLPNIVYEMFGRIFMEALITNADLLDNSFEKRNSLTSAEKKEFQKIISKMAQKGTNFRLGKKHGGLREREGFVWTKERANEFYQMVESIPKINRKKNGKQESLYIWDYIYELIESRGLEAKDLLKGELSYETIPKDLLNKAFEKWQIYSENYVNIPPEDSPKMFLFQHALQNLNFPNGYLSKRENKTIPFKKSTLQKHYDEGRRLVSIKDNQVSS